MPFEFKLPDIGEGVVEGEIVKWLIKPGDLVEEDQPMVEVMTDKATVTIPSPRKGKIAQTIGKEGEVIKVGATMVVIDEAGKDGAPAAPAAKEPAKAAAPPAPPSPPSAAAPAGSREATSAAAAPVPAPSPETSNGKVLATPATRRLAREKGIDLARIPGSGPHGRVTKDDVLQFAARGNAAPPVTRPGPAPEPVPATVSPSAPAPSPAGLEERVAFVGLRRRIAEKMSKSKHTAAHFTYVDEVDMTSLVGLRKELKPMGEEQGVKITYLPFIIKGVIAALKKYPFLNASLEEDKGELVLKKYYNIGVAVATPTGLIVPVVKDAEHKSMLEVAREIEQHANNARNGTLKLEDLQGGTFTITSLGALGGLFATPIINHPEVAILGVNRIAARPVVRDGQIVIRDTMYLSLSFDHRIVDGAVGAEFTTYLIKLLEDPHRLFMHMV